MSFKITNDNIDKLAKVLGVELNSSEDGWTWKMSNPINNQALICTIYNNAGLGEDKTGVLISCQTKHGYFELHDCNGFMVFEPDEVIFINANEKFVSSITIGKESTCSMFSNIDRSILGADFSELDPAVLLSAMQLSLAEQELLD